MSSMELALFNPLSPAIPRLVSLASQVVVGSPDQQQLQLQLAESLRQLLDCIHHIQTALRQGKTEETTAPAIVGSFT